MDVDASQQGGARAEIEERGLGQDFLGNNRSQFLEGSLHQVRWHPPDYGRLFGIFLRKGKCL